MATLTFALDTLDTLAFDGYGTHSGVWSQTWPTIRPTSGQSFGGTACHLTDEAFADWAENISLFTWLRDGFPGVNFRESLGRDRNYYADKQADRVSSLNRDHGPFSWIVTPAGAPSKTISQGWNRTRSLHTSIAQATRQSLMAFVSSTANWQAWADMIFADIDAAMNLGCNVEIFGSPNENSLASVGNEVTVYLTSAQFVDFFREVWLGASLAAGAGVKDRYPWMRLLCDDVIGNSGASRLTYYDAVIADGAVEPEVDYFGYHFYGAASGGYTSAWIEQTAGIYDRSRASWSEAGAFLSKTSGYDVGDVLKFITPIRDGTVYGRSAGPVIAFTSLRDVAAMSATDYRGVTFTAKPMFDLDSSAGTFTPLPFWWAMKPLLLAAGRGPCTAYRAGGATTNSNFDPSSGVLCIGFRRDDPLSANCDNRRAFVYYNLSGSGTTDTLRFTSAGAGAGLSARRRDFGIFVGSEGPWVDSPMDGSGDVALGPVPSGTAVLVELY